MTPWYHALDPTLSQGCRSKLIEHKILEKDPNKRIILLVNKIDLVPKQVALTVPLFPFSRF